MTLCVRPHVVPCDVTVVTHVLRNVAVGMPRRHVTSHDFRSGIDTCQLTLDMLTSRHVTHGLASHVMSMICEEMSTPVVFQG